MKNEKITVDNFISEKNLSIAWAKAFLKTIDAGINEISPLLIEVSELSGNRISETLSIRDTLDSELERVKKLSCNKNADVKKKSGASLMSVHATANTIFPLSLWKKKRERALLFKRYKKIFCKLQKEDKLNKYGTYFERLINFCPKNQQNGFNQLEKIIEIYQSGNRRRSALQATLLDPSKDLTAQRQRGFPCLQQVAFIPIENEELMIVGFYPKELIFERAYGNYLGLCRLGLFMAHEMGLRLSKMQCLIGVAKHSNFAKSELKKLEGKLKDLLKYHD